MRRRFRAGSPACALRGRETARGWLATGQAGQALTATGIWSGPRPGMRGAGGTRAPRQAPRAPKCGRRRRGVAGPIAAMPARRRPDGGDGSSQILKAVPVSDSSIVLRLRGLSMSP